MITLFQTPPAWGVASISPFCVKLETYLRMTGLAYESKMGNPMQAPKGKIPFVKIGDEVLGDSGLIIEHLKKKYGDPIDQHLNPEERARGLAIVRLVEDHLYFAVAWLRWNEPVSRPHVREYFLGLLPPVIGPLIFMKIRKDMLANSTGHGMGRHAPAEILAFAKEDIAALSVLLGEKPYFLGQKASTVDATVYGFLVQIIHMPWESEIKRYVMGFANLTAFDRRMKEKYWS